MKIETKSRITVFILAILAWWALTGGGMEEWIAGIIIAAIIALLVGKFFITSGKQTRILHRLFSGIRYLFLFIWEMIKANISVAYIVIHPLRPIKPGIIKIKSALTKDISMTILGNSITLTPGTFTVDLNPAKKELYIHCITIKSTDIDENTKDIGQRFEPLLKEVFE
ncbi:Na+/H+ antiporter subunit E [candidate division KSB1 bacterium]|nr:Na+/H+ antiporter subunit E [candidate division KSB1 bacterium]